MPESSAIFSYRPEIKVEIAGDDVTHLLGDTGSVRISKTLYAPHGEALITFPDRPYVVGGRRDSAYGMWEPFDPIIISIRRWAEETDVLPQFRVVFRGLLRSIGRNESVDDVGRPHRFVNIVAHDCGCVFLVEQVHPAITWQNRGTYPPNALATYVNEYGLTADPVPSAQFLWDVAYETTKDIMDHAGFEFMPVMLTESGTVVPYQALSQEGPIWNVLARYADQPWNEFFVREGPDQPTLVYRPTPWIDSFGNPLPDANISLDNDVMFVNVRKGDAVILNAHRDDAELVNHVWVQSPSGSAGGNARMIEAQSGDVNVETRAKFGDRVQQVTTYQLPTEPNPSISADEQTHFAAINNLIPWINARKEWMVRAGDDIHKFERGTMTIKGFEFYDVGNYVVFMRSLKSDALHWAGYCVGVIHDFKPFNRYLCTLEYIRSTQWMRRQFAAQPYDEERQRGVDFA